MDESSWRIAQIGMWIIGGQTAVLGFIFLFIWNSFYKKVDDLATSMKKENNDCFFSLSKQITNFSEKLDKIETKIFERIDRNEAKFNAKLDSKIDPIQHSMNELDKRLYGIETVLHMKDCCVLKQDQNLKKAE